MPGICGECPGGVAKIPSEFPLVVLYVEVPGALELHDELDGVPCASFSARLGAYEVGCFQNIVHSVAGGHSASACLHYGDVGKVVSEVHYFFRSEVIFSAEVLEVFDLVA